jgi:class 3 adenylate cyclase
MPVTSRDSVLEADVLTGAVAFTDICGFTEFTAVRGDRDALLLLATQERLVRSCLPEGARVVKDLGDGLLLWFPDAASAVSTTLRLQDAFEAEAAATELPLWVRIGLHWGTQTKRGDDLIGHDVNIASRVVDVAGPTEVVITDQLLTQATQSDSLDGVDIEELGPVVMKGLPEPVRLFRIAHESAHGFAP